MIFWIDFYFIDANRPLIEQIIFFHDYSIFIIFVILYFLFLSLLDLLFNNVSNLNLIENQTIELIWTFLPVLVLFFIAVPSLRLLYLIEERFDRDLNIKVLGYQWYWSYEYTEFDVEFDCFLEGEENNFFNFRLLETDRVLILPLNSFINLLIRRNDVIHSWTVQRLGVKTDAIPGRLNQLNLFFFRPGLYFGQCSEICGVNHRFIPISLIIVRVDLFIDYIKSFK